MSAALLRGSDNGEERNLSGSLFPWMEGSDHHLQRFFHGMNALVTFYKNTCDNRGARPSPQLSHRLTIGQELQDRKQPPLLDFCYFPTADITNQQWLSFLLSLSHGLRILLNILSQEATRNE